MNEPIAHSGTWGIALIVIVLASWLLYRQEGRLITDRLYGLVRHPQYTGLFVALFGEGVVHWPTIFSVALFPIIVLAYYLLARSEERKVEDEFGEAYREYRKRVPMFIPRWGEWRKLATTRDDTPA